MALSLEEILKQQSGETVELEDSIDINSGGTFTLDEILNNKPTTPSQPEKKSNDSDESLEPEAEDNSNISGLTAATAGIISGAIKVPEGVISLAADLIDLGLDTNSAAKVEQFFDTLNPFEELAQERAIGRLTEALVQIGVPGAIGAKVATKLATKALNAKKTGNYLNLGSKNVKNGLKATENLNKLTGRQKFGAVVVGGLGKFIKYYKTNYSNPLMTYADRRFGEGLGYEKVGFEYYGETGVDYWYSDGRQRYDRFVVKAEVGKSEREKAAEMNLYKVWGCGSNIWVLR